MNEFFTEITNSANLLATGLLGLTLLYWLLVIFGAVGMDALDFDMDFDADPDLDVEFADGFLGTLFAFFHVGKVPVMIIASFFTMFFWLSTIFTNHYFNPDFDLWVTAMWLFPCGAVSLLLTKICVAPIAKGFVPEKKEWDRNELVGRTAEVHTLELSDRHGEIVFETDGPPMVLNARNQTGQTLRKGDIVMVVAYDRENDICLVELAKLESK